MYFGRAFHTLRLHVQQLVRNYYELVPGRSAAVVNPRLVDTPVSASPASSQLLTSCTVPSALPSPAQPITTGTVVTPPLISESQLGRFHPALLVIPASLVFTRSSSLDFAFASSSASVPGSLPLPLVW